jgi:hypothetical protein
VFYGNEKTRRIATLLVKGGGKLARVLAFLKQKFKACLNEREKENELLSFNKITSNFELALFDKYTNPQVLLNEGLSQILALCSENNEQ